MSLLGKPTLEDRWSLECQSESCLTTQRKQNRYADVPFKQSSGQKKRFEEFSTRVPGVNDYRSGVNDYRSVFTFEKCP